MVYDNGMLGERCDGVCADTPSVCPDKQPKARV